MTPRPLLLTGMFRSGTTMVARALNAHPDIAFASDPFLAFFKKLRSDVALEQGQPVPVGDPLSDYYFSDRGLALLKAIVAADPDRPLPREAFSEAIDFIRRACVQYSPSLVPFLDSMSGTTYGEWLHSMIEQIQACYGDHGRRVAGFKEVWATEFVPLFLRSDPAAKAIIMMRDPRAVCASKNSTSEKYPWIFLCRQWRKLAVLARWCEMRYTERVMVLKLEDLVYNPDTQMRRVCEFLDIAWHANVADPSTYRDGGGAPWKQNTSYQDGGASFNTATLERWRSQLSPDAVRLIDYMCGPEMELFGYRREAVPSDLSEFVAMPPVVDDQAIASWIRPFASNDPEVISTQLRAEGLRDKIMDGELTDPAEMERAFLFPKAVGPKLQRPGSREGSGFPPRL